MVFYEMTDSFSQYFVLLFHNQKSYFSLLFRKDAIGSQQYKQLVYNVLLIFVKWLKRYDKIVLVVDKWPDLISLSACQRYQMFRSWMSFVSVLLAVRIYYPCSTSSVYKHQTAAASWLNLEHLRKLFTRDGEDVLYCHFIFFM